MPLRYELKAPAKINLHLAIHGLRPDGYHALSMWMHTLALADTLYLNYNPRKSGVVLTCSDPELEGESNLVVRACQAFAEAADIPVDGLTIFLEKQIPHQAGLGGGSSNAAAILRWLNHFCGEPLAPAAMQRVALSLGSDVPFFLSDGAAWVTGRGEAVMPVPVLPGLAVVLVKPRNLAIATPEAFGWVKAAQAYRDETRVTTLAKALEQDPQAMLGADACQNDFEPVVFSRYPQLQAAKASLLKMGAITAGLSGSGPTLYGIFKTTPADNLIQSAFPADAWWTEKTQFAGI